MHIKRMVAYLYDNCVRSGQRNPPVGQYYLPPGQPVEEECQEAPGQSHADPAEGQLPGHQLESFHRHLVLSVGAQDASGRVIGVLSLFQGAGSESGTCGSPARTRCGVRALRHHWSRKKTTLWYLYIKRSAQTSPNNFIANADTHFSLCL